VSCFIFPPLFKPYVLRMVNGGLVVSPNPILCSPQSSFFSLPFGLFFLPGFLFLLFFILFRLPALISALESSVLVLNPHFSTFLFLSGGSPLVLLMVFPVCLSRTPSSPLFQGVLPCCFPVAYSRPFFSVM